MQSMPPPRSWRSTLLLSSHLSLGLPSALLPSGSPTKTLYTPLLPPIHATCPAHILYHPNNIWWAIQIIKLHVRVDHYAASSGNFLPTFRDHYSLRNDPEERSSHLLRGGSLKSRIILPFVWFSPFICYFVPLRPKYSPRTPTAHVPPLMWETKFHTHTK